LTGNDYEDTLFSTPIIVGITGDNPMSELDIPCAVVDTDSISFDLAEGEMNAVSIDADTFQRVFIDKANAKKLRDWLNDYLGEQDPFKQLADGLKTALNTGVELNMTCAELKNAIQLLGGKNGK
jgi:hypothetical protein